MARPDDLADATVLVGNPVVNCRGGGIFGLPSQYPVVSGEHGRRTFEPIHPPLIKMLPMRVAPVSRSCRVCPSDACAFTGSASRSNNILNRRESAEATENIPRKGEPANLGMRFFG